MSQTPRGAELWRQVLDSRLLDVHTALPGEVTAFNSTEQTVDVQPMIQNVVGDTAESYPEIRNVPVLWPRCGKFIVAFPLEAGDLVTLLFSEWSLDSFRAKGKEVHPVHLDRHSFGGAMAFPGAPWPSNTTISETLDGLVVGHDGGALIRIKDDGTIAIGSTAGAKQAVALADEVKTQLQTIVSAIKGGVATPNDGGAGLKATIVAALTDPIPSVGSSVAEVEE